MLCFSVMEIACGQHGDIVPNLVVAAQSDSSALCESTPEAKRNNSNSFVKKCDVLDAKCLLQDGLKVDNVIFPNHTELLGVQKLVNDVETDGMNDQLSWKPADACGSDKMFTTLKPASTVTRHHCLICCKL